MLPCWQRGTQAESQLLLHCGNEVRSYVDQHSIWRGSRRRPGGGGTFQRWRVQTVPLWLVPDPITASPDRAVTASPCVGCGKSLLLRPCESQLRRLHKEVPAAPLLKCHGVDEGSEWSFEN